MEDKFSKIDTNQDKVNKIIQCGYKVFARNSLEKASTNMIVKEAGISRGILYHYFEDKQELFDFLMYFSVKKSIEELDKAIDWNDGDLIKRYKVMTKHRIHLIAKYPQMIEFLTKYGYMSNRYKEQFPSVLNWKERFYSSNVDYDLFKEQENIKAHIRIISWTFKGMTNEFLFAHEENSDDTVIDAYIQKVEDYYNLMAKLFY